jgi:hypothetical protein
MTETDSERIGNMNVFDRLFGRGETVNDFDVTEALPVEDIEYIGMDDVVRYEYVNEWDIVTRSFVGTVIGTCYITNRALVQDHADGATYWCFVDRLSIVTANAAVETATFAA